MIIKVISLWQPWALAMWNLLKEYETRSERFVSTSGLRGYEGWLGIQAAQKPWLQAIDEALGGDRDLCKDFALKCIEYLGDAPVEKEYYGTLGGICHFSGIYQTQQIAPKLSEREIFFGNYSEGRRALHCPGMVKLPTPIPMRGMQGVWNWEVPPEIEGLLLQRGGE